MASEHDHWPANVYAALLQQRREVELRVVTRASEDDAFRKKLLSAPKAALEEELGIALPVDAHINVHEETPTTAYLRIPSAPRGVEMSEELSEESLEKVAGGGIVISWEDTQGGGILVVMKKRAEGSGRVFVVW